MKCPSYYKTTSIEEVTLSFAEDLLDDDPSPLNVNILCSECECEYGTFIYQCDITNYTKALCIK